MVGRCEPVSQRRRIVPGCTSRRAGRDVVAEPNDQLRRARERTESPHATGEPLSRQELAELVNREAQLEMIGWVQQGGLPGLTDPDVVADARR